MIVAISGLLEDSRGNRRIAGAGKDEAAKVLVQNGFVSVAFADIMKRWCKELYGFTDEQLWGSSSKRTEGDLRYCRARRENDDPDDIRDIIENVEPMKLYTGDRLNYLTPRYALQKLGDWGRDCFPDIWANKALEIIKELFEPWIPPSAGLSGKWRRYNPQEGLEDPEVIWNKKPYPGAVIPDCRFQNEFRRVKEEGGTTIRITRFVDEFPDQMDDSHVSERDILEWGDEKFDYVITNNEDVAALHQQVLVALGLQSIAFPSVQMY